MKIELKILGTGCAKCKQLEELTQKVVQEIGLECSIEKVTDIAEIVSYQVLSTPALVINEKVIFSGKVPSFAQLKEIFTNLGEY